MFSSLSSSALNRRDAMKYAAFSITSAFLLSSCGVGTSKPGCFFKLLRRLWWMSRAPAPFWENLADQLRSSIAPDQKALRGPNSAAGHPPKFSRWSIPHSGFPGNVQGFQRH